MKKKAGKKTAPRLNLAADADTIRLVEATSLLLGVRKAALIKRAMASYLKTLPSSDRANILRLVKQIPRGAKETE